MEVKIKKIYEDVLTPTRGTTSSAGYDLYAYLEEDKVTLKPGETFMFHTGICFEIPEGYFGGVFARSGLAAKRNLRPANCVAVIDSDYRGELMVPIYNDSSTDQTLEKNERIAQIVILPYLNVDFVEVDSLADTDRGTGGFGSTGTK